MNDSRLSLPASVPNLYHLALWEGEGLGTAYEYSVKLKLLRRVVSRMGPPRRVLVGGLPEAYGVDLSLALLAGWYDCQVVVAEDREPLLQTFFRGLEAPPLAGRVDPGRFEMRLLDTLARPTLPGDEPFDLWVTTSSIQRLDAAERAAYMAQVRATARSAVIMVPNKDNRAHTTITHIDGIYLPDLVALCQQAGLAVREADYLDLPPFPPGITRSAQAKEGAANSPIERLIMVGLEGLASVERFWPRFAKRPFSHIAYAVVESTS